MKAIPLFRLTIQRGLSSALTAMAVVCSGLSGELQAQSSPDAVSVQAEAGIFSPAELEELLGPIALYPDALIALILPASTAPTEITLASRFLAGGGTVAEIEGQTWEESVKSLARYPEVVSWLDENLAWTTSLGDAFATQAPDVMNALQRLREKARAAGNLQDSSEQTVVEEVVEDDSYIRIVPADPEYIYVPVYNPQLVFGQSSYVGYGSLVSFSTGFAIGAWLNYDCDWRRRGIYCGSYRPGWNRPWVRGERHRGARVQTNAIVNSNTLNVVNINSRSARNWNPGAGSLRRSKARRAQVRNASSARVDRPGIQDVNGSLRANSNRFTAPGSRSARATRQGSDLRERGGQNSASLSLGRNSLSGRQDSKPSSARAGSRTQDRNISPQKRFSKRGGSVSQTGKAPLLTSQAPSRVGNRENGQNAVNPSRGASFTRPGTSSAPQAQALQSRSPQLSGSSRNSQAATLRRSTRRSQGSTVQSRQTGQNLNRSAGSRSRSVGVQTSRQSRATGLQSSGNSTARRSSAGSQSSRGGGSWGGAGGNSARGQRGR